MITCVLATCAEFAANRAQRAGKRPSLLFVMGDPISAQPHKKDRRLKWIRDITNYGKIYQYNKNTQLRTTIQIPKNYSG